MTLPPLTLAFAACLVFSSLSTKAMGLAWLLLVLSGIWTWIKHRGQVSFSKNSPWLKTWLIFAFFGLIFKAVPTVFWSDPWAERHGELRIFLSALAIFALASYHILGNTSWQRIAHALSIASALGLLWVIAFGRNAVPTNAIPWAGSMAMISAFLLAMALKSDAEKFDKRIWLVGGLLAAMAVLVSESRGSYGVIVWWFGVCAHHAWTTSKTKTVKVGHKGPRQFAQPAIVVTALTLGVALLGQTSIATTPLQRMELAIQEVQASRQSVEAGANSSVGARLYLWQQSWGPIQDSPWIGHGHDHRKALIAEWAEKSRSSTIKSLGHLHNEYLHQLLDHGMMGLASQLCYFLGFWVVTHQLLRAKQVASATAIAGIGFIHLTASLTNVNFAHNYYPLSLSLLVIISLWMACRKNDISD